MNRVIGSPHNAAPDRSPLADAASQARIVAALARAVERDAGAAVEVFETHISYVIVGAGRAYKLKKPVNLGFLDFTTLGARRFYCDEELRLNARLAPMLYRRVVPITGTADTPKIGGTGPVLDYAVEMIAFPQDALLTNVLGRGALLPRHIDALAQVLARFHAGVARSDASSRHGRADDILSRAKENLTTLDALLTAGEDRDRLDRLERWTVAEHAARRALFEERRAQGFVRECHGDLHLSNVLLQDGAIVPFDCIEFSEDLRWIDVMSEVAFTAMDLDARGRPGYAARLLNAYLELGGDYGGVRVLRFYLVYRALVRAKVAAIRESQVSGASEQDRLERECSKQLRLALSYAWPVSPAVILTHGFSGSGKTTLTQPLLEHLHAIRLRSDVERKRLHGLAAGARSGAGYADGIYAAESTAVTYRRLLDATQHVLDAGYPVIVDATFLRRWQRAPFEELAARTGVPFVILTFPVPVEVLRERIDARHQTGTDASEATREVLAHQVLTDEPLTIREAEHEVIVDGRLRLEDAEGIGCWTGVLRAIAGSR